MMIDWVSDNWPLCLAIALIGIALVAWLWLGRSTRRRDALPDDGAATPLSKAPAAPTPLEPVKPVIDVAQPVQFVAHVAAEPVPAPAASAGQDNAGGTIGGDRPVIAAAVGDPDNLALIKGVGPKLNALLTSLGVTRFDQIAAWSAADIAEVDRFLGTFKGRIERDNWVEQAAFLASGDHAGFAAKYGALGSELK